MEKVFIIIPCKIGDGEKGRATAEICVKRSGLDKQGVETKIIIDELNEGFFSLVNKAEKYYRSLYDWFVYCPNDYFPGNNFLKIALEQAKLNSKRFVCFNDGKWGGNNATAGMIHRTLVPLLYETNTLFHIGYKHHGGDPDLTERTKILGEFLYVPEALLIEIDYKKDLKCVRTNEADTQFYLKRKMVGFPR